MIRLIHNPLRLVRYSLYYIILHKNPNTLKYINGKRFVKILNITNALLGNKIRFRFADNMYSFRDNNNFFYFHSKPRIFYYVEGLNRRIEQLKKEYLIEDIEFNHGDTIVDIGANVGEVFKIFQSLDVEYIAFEPDTQAFQCLKKNAQNQNVNNVALWNKKASMIFYESTENADSSLIRPSSYITTRTVETKTLDDFEINRTIKLLKLEAEGAEPEILLGSLKTLKYVIFLTVDAGPERGVNLEETIKEVSQILKKQNFRLIKSGLSRRTYLFYNEKMIPSYFEKNKEQLNRLS